MDGGVGEGREEVAGSWGRFVTIFMTVLGVGLGLDHGVSSHRAWEISLTWTAPKLLL